jgi:acyl dehydratase
MIGGATSRQEPPMPAEPQQISTLAPGAGLPPLDKPRLTSSHIVRWLAAQQNWDKIHYDQAYCTQFARLDRPVINGGLKQHLIVQFLQQAFAGAGWVWRVHYQFTGPDFVGEQLRVQGGVAAVERTPEHVFVTVAFEIVNLDRQQETTRGQAVVLLARDGGPVLDALALAQAPAALALATHTADDGSAPEAVRQRIGQVIETRMSAYPVDLSRLRLFADAVMGLAPIFFDPAAAARGPYGVVVAPPLFPLHGIEAVPGTLPLSEAPEAMGREGVNEVGRDPASLFGLAAGGGMNAGNQAEVHSLVRAGERVGATSTLVGARSRPGREGGQLLFVETLNRYTEAGGRPLLTERQTIVLKLP